MGTRMGMKVIASIWTIKTLCTVTVRQIKVAKPGRDRIELVVELV